MLHAPVVDRGSAPGGPGTQTEGGGTRRGQPFAVIEAGQVQVAVRTLESRRQVALDLAKALGTRPSSLYAAAEADRAAAETLGKSVDEKCLPAACRRQPR